MATSSQDQSTTVNTQQNQVSISKGRLWLRLVIAFVVFILIAFLILVLLTYLKILPPQWFVPLLVTLSPVLGSIGAFVNATLSDKDFQQAFRKWLTEKLFGASDTSTNTTSQPGITVNFSPTITNTNTNTVTPTTDAAGKSLTEGLTHQPKGAQELTHRSPDDVAASLRAPTPPNTHSPAASVTQQQPGGSSTTANSPVWSEAIFFVNMRLTNPSEFFGREIERVQLLSRTRNGGSTSIVGPRRSGKTWLMSNLRLVAAEELGTNFRIGYIRAALPSSATIAGFTREALKALGYPFYSLPEHPDLALLEHFVHDIVAQNNTPILCIDEFEGLTHHTEFDLQFFEELRAITEVGLGLVVLSKDPLIDIVSERTRTSPFFNVFLQLPLVPFNREEAEKFVQTKGTKAQFTEQERAYMLAYSRIDGEQIPPLRLQLVGEMLLNDKRVAATVDQHHYSPNDPEYWQAFKERVDVAYEGMVRS